MDNPPKQKIESMTRSEKQRSATTAQSTQARTGKEAHAQSYSIIS